MEVFLTKEASEYGVSVKAGRRTLMPPFQLKGSPSVIYPRQADVSWFSFHFFQWELPGFFVVNCLG